MLFGVFVGFCWLHNCLATFIDWALDFFVGFVYFRLLWCFVFDLIIVLFLFGYYLLGQFIVVQDVWLNVFIDVYLCVVNLELFACWFTLLYLICGLCFDWLTCLLCFDCCYLVCGLFCLFKLDLLLGWWYLFICAI